MEWNNSQMIINENESYKIRYISIIESLLFARGEALGAEEIADIIGGSVKFAESLIEDMITMYEKDDLRGLKIVKINGMYQMVTKEINSDEVQKLLKTNIRQSLSQAALETLAIVAYKQPITRAEVEEIRGVKSDRAVSNLVQRKLIKESGRKEVPGRPILYVTTDQFLRYFDLEKLEQLPGLDELSHGEDETETEENLDYFVNNAINSKE